MVLEEEREGEEDGHVGGYKSNQVARDVGDGNSPINREGNLIFCFGLSLNNKKANLCARIK